MQYIRRGHLEFLEEAKAAFEENPFQETYRDAEESYIALRMGVDRDCIMIYELGEYVTNFVQQLNPMPLKRIHPGGKINDKRINDNKRRVRGKR